MFDPYVKSTELAAILNVNPTTVRRWIVKGLPVHNKIGKTYIFYLGDVYIWLLTQHKTSKTNKWGPRYRRISAYVNNYFDANSIKFHQYTYKKRIELHLNGPKTKIKRRANK